MSYLYDEDLRAEIQNDIISSEYEESFNDFVEANIRTLAEEYAESLGDPSQAYYFIDDYRKGREMDFLFEEFCREEFDYSL